MRRVVITGLGIVSPVGCGVEASWADLLAGKSGARRIEEFEVSDLSCQIACFVPRGANADGKFNPDDWMEPKEQRKVDDFIIYAIAAADQAIADSGFEADTPEKQERAGVLIGSGIGGLPASPRPSILLKEKGPRRVSPVLHSRPPDQPRLRLRLDQAPAQGPEPRRGHGLLDRRARHRRCGAAHRARRRRRDGRGRHRKPHLPHRASPASPPAARFRPASTIDPTRPRAPTTRTATASSWARAPASSCSKSYEHAKARGAKIYAEVIGYGLSGDAYHITAPAENGDGAYRCMRAALKRAGIDVERHRLRQRARHLDADGRRDRARRRRAPVRQRRRQARDVVDQVGDRPSARRRRRGRGDLLDRWPSATTSRRRP